MLSLRTLRTLIFTIIVDRFDINTASISLKINTFLENHLMNNLICNCRKYSYITVFVFAK